MVVINRPSDCSCLKAKANEGALSVTSVLGSPNCFPNRLKKRMLFDDCVSCVAKYLALHQKNQWHDTNSTMNLSLLCRFHPFSRNLLPYDYAFSTSNKSIGYILGPNGKQLYDKHQFHVLLEFLRHPIA